MTEDQIRVLRPIVTRVWTGRTAIKGSQGGVWTDEPLTAESVRRHLNCGPARGASAIVPGTSVTMLALLDFDSHKGDVSWDDMVLVAGGVLIEMVLGFLIAEMLVTDPRPHRLMVALMLLPVMVMPVVVGYTWRVLWDAQYGPINQMIGWIIGHPFVNGLRAWHVAIFANVMQASPAFNTFNQRRGYGVTIIRLFPSRFRFPRHTA
jgi:hypothetical protein